MKQRNETLSTDTVFEMLSNRYRRVAVACLLEHGSETPVDDLVEYIASAIGDGQERVRIALYHNHLPKLSDAGVIEYCRASGAVELRPAIRDLAFFVEWTEQFETA